MQARPPFFRTLAPALCATMMVTAASASPAPTVSVPAATPAQLDDWEALRASDLRLASLAYRLSVANAALCTEHMPATGLVLQAIDEFAPELRSDARRAFSFEAPVTVEAVVPNSPADRSGARANDGLRTINGQPVAPTPLSAAPSTELLNSVENQINVLPADQPVRLELITRGQRVIRYLRPVPACRIRTELLTDDRLLAHTDDQLIQISSAYLARFDDSALVVVVAHEMAHILLHHTARLDAAEVHRGILGEFGRSARMMRNAEDDADRYSVRILRNAGFDPQIAVRFWLMQGHMVDGGPFRSATHGSPAARAAIIADEIRREAN